MASSIVTSAAKQLGSLVANEGQSLYEVSDKIERLQRDLEWMECFLKDADNRQHREKIVAKWVAEIRDFAYEAEELLERYVHEVSHPRQKGWWNTVIWLSCLLCDARALHEVGSSVDDLRTRVTEMTSRLKIYGLKVSHEEENLAIKRQRQTYSHINEVPIGLEKQTRKVVSKLLTEDEGVKAVSICGMGGVGKTTLARQVFQDKSIKERFKNRLAWVCVSEQYEIRVVYKEILMGLSNVNFKELRDLTDGQLSQKIFDILKNEICLVVLDDLWKDNDWDVLKSAFESISSHGSKILITTRNNDLIKHVDAHHGYGHKSNTLDDQDSLKLLVRISAPERLISEVGLKNLAEEMLKHCKGLPLAIVTLGGVLSNKKTIAEWEIVHKNIKNHLMGDMEHRFYSKELYAVLDLSYKDLPYYLKPCFMYLANFPEDYEIKVDRLYHLWEAEGLVTNLEDDDADEIQEVSLDDIAKLYLNELVKRCLVQVSKFSVDGSRIKSCRLHDVMREFCLKKCKEVNFLHIIKRRSPKEPSSKNARSFHVNRKLRRCSLHQTETTASSDFFFDPSPNASPCIRSLLTFEDGGANKPKKLVPPKMSTFFSLLRVLDLEGACIAMGSETFANLIHLRYLSFKRAKLIPLLAPHIWNCLYLETLDLRCDEGDKLEFSNNFCKLERLRHLYLPTELCLKGSGMLFLTDTQLQQMETLKNFDSKKCQVADMQKMTSLRIFRISEWDSLTTSKVIELMTSPVIVTKRLIKPFHLPVKASVIDEERVLLDRVMNEATPCISGFDINGRIAANNFAIFHKILKRLWLNNSEIDKKGIKVLEKLPHLTDLTLAGKTFAGGYMRFSSGCFRQLCYLRIENVKELNEWEIGERAAPKLESLRLVGCTNLIRVPVGLPTSVYVECQDPCIPGVENYNICPCSASAATEASSSITLQG